MILFLTPILIIVLLVIFTFYLSHARARKRKNQLKWLFDFLRCGRRLIQYVPAHRGMANAFLKGDASFKNKMSEMQSNIDQNFEQLLIVAENPLSVVETNEVNYLATQWSELKNNVFNYSAEQSFAKHTAIVTGLLEIMEDAAELASISAASKESLLITKAVMRELPQLTETLGQVRGLGTGVAAQGECSVANRIKLSFLRENGMGILNDTINSLLDSNHLKLDVIKSPLQACKDKAHRLFDCINDKLLTATVINISSNEFYATATVAIDESFVLLDKLLDVLEEIILDKKK